MKYRELLEKLNTAQKIALLTDSGFLASPEAAAAGLPRVRFSRLGRAGDSSLYPTPEGAANSWNLELIGRMAEELALDAREEGADALIVPPANVKSNIYGAGASEDPYLAGTLAGAYAAAVSRAGAVPCVTCCALGETDAEFSDKKANARALKEYFLKAFETAAAALPADTGAFVASRACLPGEYETVNAGFVHDWLRGGIGKERFILCEGTGAESAAEALRARDATYWNASARKLESAVETYLRLKKSVEEGSVPPAELDAACRAGTACPEEELDAAAERALDFAFACRRAPLERAEDAQREARQKKAAETSLRLAEESMVLLKNENRVLPLRKGARVAVIGPAARAEDFAPGFPEYLASVADAAGLTYIGYADGYGLNEDRSEELLPEACELARQADAALVFLGLGNRRGERIAARRTKLPANQLALLDALRGAGGKLVAVATDDCQIDAGFDAGCGALIAAPRPGAYGAEALVRLLTGESNFSGKLAATWYDEADETFASLRRAKDLGRNKVGTFFGYRHYDTSDIQVRYPFGFGLSYTKFEYSRLSVNKEEVRLQLKNTGKTAGAEIVQVYVGKEDSALVRPKKELKGFAKVYLKPGESKEVCVPFPPDAFVVYDETGEPRTEHGYYEVYIAASVSDVRLKGKVFVFGDRLDAGKEALADYLQTRSNIVSGGYVMETPGKGIERKQKIFMIVSAIVAALFDALYVLLGFLLSNELTDDIYDLFLVLSGFLIVVNLVMIAAVLLFFVSRSRRKKRAAAEFIRQKEKAAEEESEERAYESLFDEAFAALPGTAEKDLSARTAEPEETNDDGEISLRRAAENFVLFAGERGIGVDQATARTVLAAMAASRLVLLKSRTPELLPPFVSLIGEYFGVPAFLNEAKDYKTTEDVLMEREEDGSYAETAVAKALNAAAERPSRIHVAYLPVTGLAGAGDWFMPFMRYILNPQKTQPLSRGSGDEASYRLSPNLWFFFGLPAGARWEEIPSFLANAAYAVRADLFQTAEAEEKTPFAAPSRSKFLKWAAACEADYPLGEEKWKKVDKFERYVSGATDGRYRIGNKSWRSMERFVGVYLACGGEEAEALDGVVAAKLLASALPAISGKTEDANGALPALENIFGEENLAECRRMTEEQDGAPSL